MAQHFTELSARAPWHDLDPHSYRARARALGQERRMRPITTHATRTVPIPRPMTQPRVAVPEKALSQPYTDCSPESRVGRYGVALAFSKANVQRSRAASRAEFGKGVVEVGNGSNGCAIRAGNSAHGDA